MEKSGGMIIRYIHVQWRYHKTADYLLFIGKADKLLESLAVSLAGIAEIHLILASSRGYTSRSSPSFSFRCSNAKGWRVSEWSLVKSLMR